MRSAYRDQFVYGSFSKIIRRSEELRADNLTRNQAAHAVSDDIQLTSRDRLANRISTFSEAIFICGQERFGQTPLSSGSMTRARIDGLISLNFIHLVKYTRGNEGKAK